MTINLPKNVTADAVRNQLAMILASEPFKLSHRLSRFLVFIVEHELEGKTEPLKEYVIGVEVFDKDPSFDPSVDSIVRVEAGRLRNKLKQFYDEKGRDSPVRIELPKRTYVPSFQRLDQEQIDHQASDSKLASETPYPISFALRRPIFWYGIGLLLLLVVAWLYVWQRVDQTMSIPARDNPTDIDEIPPRFSVAVLPLRSFTEEQVQDYVSDGLTDVLITNLAKVKPLQVISFTSVMGYKGTDKPLPEIARELNVIHIVEGCHMSITLSGLATIMMAG